MSLSQIAKTIRPSPTLRLNEMAAILREKGDPIIHLGGGEPKSRAPIDAILAAAGHLNSGEVRYAPAQQGDIRASAADISAIVDALGWRPEVDLSSGMAATVRWAQQASRTRA